MRGDGGGLWHESIVKLARPAGKRGRFVKVCNATMLSWADIL